MLKVLLDTNFLKQIRRCTVGRRPLVLVDAFNSHLPPSSCRSSSSLHHYVFVDQFIRIYQTSSSCLLGHVLVQFQLFREGTDGTAVEQLQLHIIPDNIAVDVGPVSRACQQETAGHVM